MSAFQALGAARAFGIHLEPDGDDLLLEASEPPPDAVLDALSRHKPEVLRLLHSAKDGASDATTIMAPSRWGGLSSRKTNSRCPTKNHDPFSIQARAHPLLRLQTPLGVSSTFCLPVSARSRTGEATRPLARRRQWRLHRRHQRGVAASCNDRSVSLLVESFGRTATILKRMVQNRHSRTAARGTR